MSRIITRLLPLFLLCLFHPDSAGAQQGGRPLSLKLGDAVVTGFSGTLRSEPAQPGARNRAPNDFTFINPDGPSVRIIDVSRPGYVWDGRLFAAPKTFDVFAKDVGQVFGVALDDSAQPNIYVAATSVFGLNIVVRGRDGLPERRKKGAPGAGWMKGQFGLDLQGGPGSIYKIDGRTGVPTLFANVTLNGVPNPGPGLGNLAYDAAHKQLFVSDIHTGMIHRFALDGKELGAYDHGVSGLGAAKLAPVAFNPANRPNIASDRFDSEKPDSWGFAPVARRVWGLAVHEGRLYYSVVSGPQIWSVGIERDGSFAADPRWELDVPAQAGPLPISDIAFSNKGAMILAQRALIAGAYDYSAFTRPGEPQVFRVWLKGPNDPPSPGRWKLVPEEYAVGFAGNYRNTNGGVALGYGYAQDGMLGATACEFSLWTTAQNIRNNPALRRELEPGGPLVVHGIAGIPASPVRTFNEPPWVSYAVDYDDKFDDPRAAGHLGSVRIYTQPCAAVAGYGGAGYAANAPYIFGGGGDPVCVGPNCKPTTPVDVSIVKTGGTTPVQEPYYSFTLTISNNGAPFTGANNITVTDVLPAGMSFTSVSAAPASDWSCPTSVPAGGTLTCTYIGSGPTGTGVIGTITIGALAGGSAPYPPIKNCATVGVAPNSGYTDSDPSNNNSCVTISKPNPPIDVGIEKTGTATPGPVNTALSYTLKVTNVGAPFTGTGAIVVADPAPAGVTYTGVSWTALGDWMCTFTASAVNCSYTGSGPASTGALLGTITVTGTASGDGPWTNCATVAVAQTAGVDSNPANDKSCVTLNKDGFIPHDPPPPYSPSCGMNVLFVVDESHSIADASATYNVTSALTAAASALNNNGAQAALVRFSDNALVVQPWSTATWGSLNTGYNPATGGGTNWEAAMVAAKSLLPKVNSIAIFITDGVPTAFLDNSGAVQYTSNSVLATNEAIPVVNQIYGLGTPIIGIGIGSISTHLNALLGGNVNSTSYGGLGGTLTAIARTLCPNLYLTKQISPNYINYFYSPAPQQVTVTLKLTNTTAATVNAEVQDALPPELTSPNTFTASLGTASGNPVIWTIPGLASGATATLTFKATVSPSTPPPTDTSWKCYKNFSQVTKVNGVAEDASHLMANAVTGPVHESDEASDQVCVQNHENVNPDCGNSYLTVLKKTAFPEICNPGGSPACTFNITVTARCKAFNGPVLFGDGVFSGTTVVSPTITSITNNASPAICPWSSGWSSTTAPSSCAANISLPVNTSITFTVTLAAPLPPLPAGQKYTNCFVADGKTPVPTTFPAAYTDVHPTSDPNGGTWGNCTPFNVQSQPQGIMACPQGTTRQVKNGASECLPPPPPTCQPPMVPGPVAGQCLCPQGTVLRGKECVKQDACQPPKVPGPVAGQCICGPGTVLRGGKCVKTTVCIAPAKPNGSGGCDCPEGWTKQGTNKCVKRERKGVTTDDVRRGIDIIRGIPGSSGGGRGSSGGGNGKGASPTR